MIRKSLIFAFMLIASSHVFAQSANKSASGLDLPRFASLKSSKVNVRRGPGKQYPISWVFKQIGLPIEIVKEYENWRQIRDAEAAVGWIHVGLLSGRRTAIVLPWEVASQVGRDKNVALRGESSSSARVLAYLQPGTVVGLSECDGVWCHVSIENYRGWVAQNKLWGIYPNERVK